MAKLNANPAVEANVTFDVVEPGEYNLRVDSIEPFTSQAGNECWRTRLSFTSPVNKIDGTPAQNPGTLIDNSLVAYPPEKQGKLRSFVEACGLAWSDLDSDELIGQECIAKVGLEEYKGEQRSVVKRYLTK